MRRTAALLALTAALLAPALPALADQPAGKAGLDTSSVNGGDQGFGNCGRNSSGGVHDPLPGSAGNGNGGHTKGEVCGPTGPTDPTDPTDPTFPGDPGTGPTT